MMDNACCQEFETAGHTVSIARKQRESLFWLLCHCQNKLLWPRLRAALINGKIFRRYSHPLNKNNSSCLLGFWPPKLWTLDQIYSEVCSVEQAWNLVREHSPEPLCHYWTSTHIFAWQADRYCSMPGALLNFPGQFQLISLYPVTRVYCIFGTR